MKRLMCALLALILLSGCSSGREVLGVWEQEMEVSILGGENPGTAPSVTRITFREDGTGTMEQIISDGSHPSAGMEFTYDLKGNSLTLNFEGGQVSVYEVIRNADSLTLKNSRICYDLTYVK